MGRHKHEPGAGRHRLGVPGLLHCREFEPLASRLAALRPSLLALFRDQSRHTVATVSRTGARPKLAFVLIASM
jgi:hypothetical protein